MTRPDKRTQRLDVRLSERELTAARLRKPDGATMADWVRSLMLSTPVVRARCTPRPCPRQTVPVEIRLRAQSLHSIAITLSALNDRVETTGLKQEILAALGLVRAELHKTHEHADQNR